MEKHSHYGHRSRLRGRVRAEGLDNFQDHQVLEYVLSFVIPYKDTNPLAHRLIQKFGSLSKVLEADEMLLRQVEGMGEVSAQFLTSLIKIYNRYDKDRVTNVLEISTPNQAVNYLRGLLESKIHEEIYVICLTPKNKIVTVEKVAMGTAGEAKVTVRYITDIVSKYKIFNIIIGHNHPDGRALPSYEDDRFTKALLMSMSINDVHLLDHLIIAKDEFYSYRMDGKFDKYVREINAVIERSDKVAQPKARYEIET